MQLLGVHEKTAYRDLKDGINRLYEDLLTSVLMINL
jgi:hypothetical protein